MSVSDSANNAANLVDSLVDMVRDKLPGDLSTTPSSTTTTTTIFNPAFATFFAFCLILWALRVVLLKFLVWLGRTSYAESLRITRKPVITDKQLERESIWVFGYGYDTVAMVIVYWMGHLRDLTIASNLLVCVAWLFLWHTVLVEPIYYFFHRLLHWQWFYKNFHQYHHKSINTEPTTGVSFEIYERVSYTILFAISPLITDFQGNLSYLGLFLYYLWFDFMNEGGHINFEPLPDWLLQSPFKYILYSPTFHSVHHTKFKKNFTLFMPYMDILFGTAIYSEPKTPILPVTMPTVAAASNTNSSLFEKAKDFVLLVHAADLDSVLYSFNLHSGLAKFMQYTHKLEHKFSMYLFYPYILIISFYYSFFDHKGFHVEEDFTFTAGAAKKLFKDNNDNPIEKVKEELHGSTWAIRNLGMQYILPSFKKLINERIERAILTAVDSKVRVVGLGNFNKAEWINHGGSDIVEKLGNKIQGTYISHGDTLSAAVVFQYAMALREKGYWSRSVFVTGSTSKIGRAVVLSLAARQIPVVMYTQVKARFDEIAAEAGVNRVYLTCAHDLADGKSCDLFLTGKMIPFGKELLNSIPTGATVLNFSVPDPLTSKLLRGRPDVLHLDTGLLAYNPKVMSPNFTWLLPNGMIYACLAGSVVHAALGIEAHEVGAVVVFDMEKYWNAALALGFTIPTPTSFYNPISMPAPSSYCQKIKSEVNKMSVVTV